VLQRDPLAGRQSFSAAHRLRDLAPSPAQAPMPELLSVDATKHFFCIQHDFSIAPYEHKPGPPERKTGMSVGLITMEHDAPHGGEVHPDGDELLVVISGRLRVVGESDPGAAVELGSGEACIVKKGEWHRVHVLEKTQLMYITPGPNGDHRTP